ncbi:cation transport protein-domain-containing protein [Auriculariales sp. MPI-PUGE-AT-0066]|nr:cation transport protein-domain-containing protein [Auriculariales sp. MPI-PUGE-AT-0066]
MENGYADDNLLATLRHWKVAIYNQLNFYRIHLIIFTFTPLIFSGIFYGANGRYHISYVDALFNCVSAMTVTGLATVDLSSLTRFQQVLIFFQACIGNVVFVSWIMVYIRVHFFEKKLKHIIAAEIQRQSGANSPEDTSVVGPSSSLPARIAAMLIRRSNASKEKSRRTVSASDTKALSNITEMEETGGGASSLKAKLRANMIRRVDTAPRLINPQGWISEHGPVVIPPPPAILSGPLTAEAPPPFVESPRRESIELTVESPEGEGESPNPDRVDSNFQFPLRRRHHPDVDTQLKPTNTRHSGANFPRTQTVEFAPHPPLRAHGRQHSIAPSHPESLNASYFPRAHSYDSRNMPRSQSFGPRQYSIQPQRDIGFGGFPWPTTLAMRFIRYLFPNVGNRLRRTFTMPRTSTHMSGRDGPLSDSGRPAYLSFDAILEELGGVEYRALYMLLWVIGLYHIGTQLIGCLIIAPYISRPRWKDTFNPPNLHRPVPLFTFFQIMSAYTNTGLSLVDQSMVPFQHAYPMIVFMVFLILAGNTAFLITMTSLRFAIWIMSKCVKARSKKAETIAFLLDHPRRCFVYLFPSHQTWFLLTVLIILNFFDWAMFLLLDIGNPEFETVPLGTRFIVGLLQAVAVRTAGFGTVTMSALAPAVKVLYVCMMYISVYPIALSVRTTNVYEEKSLGVFDDEERGDGDEPSGDGPRGAVWGRYLTWHARKQLAFDMWWLGLALFLICIVERSDLQDEENASWFNIFSIVFELVSAYGTVGLSLGIPTANYSFVGALKPLSKLIICAVMIRGRHRGLPVAIDRAVMLPSEFRKPSEQPMEDDYVVVGEDQSNVGMSARRGSRIGERTLQLPRTKSLPHHKSTL